MIDYLKGAAAFGVWAATSIAFIVFFLRLTVWPDGLSPEGIWFIQVMAIISFVLFVGIPFTGPGRAGLREAWRRVSRNHR